ncbi:hypothetical protein MOSE0_N11496 [Monosporozyma servazzii]
MVPLNANGKIVVVLTLVCVSVGTNFTLLNGPQFLLTCSKFITSATDNQLINIRSLPKCIPIDTDEDFAMMTMWFYAGGMLGAVVADIVNFYHLLSLRWNLILGQLLNIAGIGLLMGSTERWMVYLGRGINGFGSGVQMSVIPVYLSLLINDLQCVPTWLTAWFNYTLMPLGILLCQIITKPLLETFHWRDIFTLGVIMHTIMLYPIFHYILESPKWYLVRGQPNTLVKKSLRQFIRNTTDDELILDEIIDCWSVELEQQRSIVIQDSIGTKKRHFLYRYFHHWTQYFTAKNKRDEINRIWLIIPLQIINAQFINQYGVKIFNDILSDQGSMTLLIILSSVQVGASLLHLFNVRKTRGSDRRPLFLSPYVNVIIGLCFLVLYFSFKYKSKGTVVSISTLVLLTLTQTVMGMNKYFIASQDPTHNHLTTQGNRLSRFCFLLGQIITSYTFPLLFDLMGPTIFIWLLIVLFSMNVVIKLYGI